MWAIFGNTRKGIDLFGYLPYSRVDTDVLL